MATQFIANDKGEKTAVVISMAEYEDLLHKRQLTLELTDEYKAMMDEMIAQDDNQQMEYKTLEEMKSPYGK